VVHGWLHITNSQSTANFPKDYVREHWGCQAESGRVRQGVSAPR
jgi:hypothetical protein